MHQRIYDYIDGQRPLVLELQRALTAIPAFNPDSGGTGESAKADVRQVSAGEAEGGRSIAGLRETARHFDRVAAEGYFAHVSAPVGEVVTGLFVGRRLIRLLAYTKPLPAARPFSAQPGTA